MKPLKKNELGLLIGLLLIGSLIILYERGSIHIYPPTLIAQDQAIQLKLIRDDQKIIIPQGDWIVAYDKLDSTDYYSGKFADISDGVILLHNENSSIQFFSADIGIIYHGEKNKVGHYKRKGLRLGGLASLAGGAFFGIASINNGGGAYDTTPLTAFVLGTAVTGCYTVPVGWIGGALVGASKDGGAIEYPLTGPEAWSIILE